MRTSTITSALAIAAIALACGCSKDEDKGDKAKAKGKAGDTKTATGKAAPSPADKAPSCEALADHAATLNPKLPPKDSERYKTGRAEFIKLCDKMFDDTARRCIAAAKSPDAAMACMRKLKGVAGAGMKRYDAKSKTLEAKKFIKRIYDGARSYFMDSGASRGMTPTPPQFPAPSQAPTPALGTCCAGGKDKCDPTASLWTSPVWVALRFSVDDPHYYSYSYTVSTDGKSFTARAHGDLDCDGKYSTFEITGSSTPGGGGGKVKMVDELE